MNSSLAQLVTLNLDTFLSLSVFALFSRPSLRKNYPWMFAYLGVRALTAAIMDFLRYGPLLASPLAYTQIYFVVAWGSLLASSVLLFLGCLDVYRQAMAPLPGLARMGTTIFRWGAIASVLVTATTLTSIAPGPGMLMKVGVQLMRCAGTAELCLLALLLVSMNSIGLSFRSRPFGIAAGLGLMAAVDCTQSIMAGMQLAMSLAVQNAFELASLLTLATWVVYAAMPEPNRKSIVVREDSAIYKWDQIVLGLDPKAAMQPTLQPAQSFFLVDVEKVVERAFVRTLKSKELES